MKILITGANGFLGQHLCRAMKDRYEVIALGLGKSRVEVAGIRYYEVDITSAEDVHSIFQNVSPDVVIHAAAMSKPDECEHNRERCININVNGTQHIINAAMRLNKHIHLVYTSTDFVFGEGGPHDEDAQPSPLNFYGQSKLSAEKLVSATGLQWTIVRPVFMYGEIWADMRPTFLHWVKQSLEENKKIKVVNDQFRTPTYVGDICKGIGSIITKKAGGVFHLAGEEILTPYQMALAIAKHFKLDDLLIEAVTADTFKEPVQRAKNGGLAVKKAMLELNYHPVKFDEALVNMADAVQRTTS